MKGWKQLNSKTWRRDAGDSSDYTRVFTITVHSFPKDVFNNYFESWHLDIGNELWGRLLERSYFKVHSCNSLESAVNVAEALREAWGMEWEKTE